MVVVHMINVPTLDYPLKVVVSNEKQVFGEHRFESFNDAILMNQKNETSEDGWSMGFGCSGAKVIIPLPYETKATQIKDLVPLGSSVISETYSENNEDGNYMAGSFW